MAQTVASTTEYYATLADHTFAIVEFTANWCPGCKAIAPLFDQLSGTFAHPGELVFLKVNCDVLSDLVEDYSLTAMPTFLFFKQGVQVAVHGQTSIQGAKRIELMAAVEKIQRLVEARRIAHDGNSNTKQ